MQLAESAIDAAASDATAAAAAAVLTTLLVGSASAAAAAGQSEEACRVLTPVNTARADALGCACGPGMRLCRCPAGSSW